MWTNAELIVYLMCNAINGDKPMLKRKSIQVSGVTHKILKKEAQRLTKVNGCKITLGHVLYTHAFLLNKKHGYYK